MPSSHHAAAIGSPSRIFESGSADNAAQAIGAILHKDVAEIAGATTSRGILITDEMAVHHFLAQPSEANGPFRAGAVETAFAAGDFRRYFYGGPCQVKVKNENAGQSISLAVGDFLQVKLGESYLVPQYQAVAAGGSVGIVTRGGACPVAYVTKAQTIAASTEALVNVFLFPPGSQPKTETFIWTPGDGVALTNHTTTLLVANGHGNIVRAGLGVANTPSTGKMQLDVKIGATSIFSVLPIIDSAGAPAAAIHTLVNTAAADVGTAGSYGTINPAADLLVPGSKVTAILDDTATWDGTGLQVQVEVCWF